MESFVVHLQFDGLRRVAPAGLIRGLVLMESAGAVFQTEEPVPGWLETATAHEYVRIASGNDTGFRIDEPESGFFRLIGHDGHVFSSGSGFFETVTGYFSPLREASVHRKTAETDISVRLNLDGTGKASIETGLPFFDHMLEQIARHGLIDLHVSCRGDLHIDEHHTIEDTALALGECLLKAIGDKKGIERYSWALPMDETLALVSLDLSGRPYLQFEADLKREYIGDFPTEMTKHFFYSLAMALKATLQMRVSGENDHHQIEALFKGFARCLRGSVARNPRIRSLVPSSKGVL
jgi:imidazoleglycerol-phosphate dehydratase/histidinol-phosphatase